MTARVRGWRMVWLVGALAACADESEQVIDDAAPRPIGAVELIGVSGRRLVDGDVYRVPLDFDDVEVAAGGVRREAFVVRNTTARAVTVLALAVHGQADGEWRLLAPVRAREIPLDARGIRLPPGVRLDFDVGFTPEVEGERIATLELIVATDQSTDVRRVELRARCARAPP